MFKRFIGLYIIFSLLGCAEAYAGPSPVREVVKKWDAVSVAINTDWFSSDILPGVTNPARPLLHNIQIQCPTTTAIQLIITYNGISKTHILNTGATISAINLYKETIVVVPGMSYNIQHLTATQNCAVVVSETYDIQ